MKLLGVTRCMTCCLVFVASTATAQLSSVSVGDTIRASEMNAIIAALNDAGVLDGNINLKASTSATGNLLKDGVRFLHSFGTGNTFLGVSAGNFTLTGSNNVGVGGEALLDLTSGSANTALGRAALAQTTTGANNTAVGTSALLFNKTGSRNTAVGEEALFVNTGNDNTAVGEDALRSNQTAFDNTAVGADALGANTTGTRNTAVGRGAIAANIDGNENTAVGENALGANTSGVKNTALGRRALDENLIGSNNTALGIDALSNSTGSSNIAIGQGAGFNQTTGDGNLYIFSGPPVAESAESGTIRIGTDPTHTRTFIQGIRNQGTGVDDAIAVLVDSDGQLGTVSSSLRYKTDVRDMGAISEGLRRLRPVTFRYQQAQAGGERLEYGLIAEEVAQVFPDIVVYDNAGRPETIQYRKVNAMLLNEVQTLHRQIQALLARVALLEHRQTN